MAKKRKNNKLIYILLGVGLLLVVIAIVGKKKGWIGEGDKTEVKLEKARKVDITEMVSASGMIQPVVEVKISPEVPGEIIELLIEEGDSVVKGQLLLELKPDNLISALERAKASLNQQRANLADAKARLARAKAQNIRSGLEYKRQKKLYSSKAISIADMETAEANYQIGIQDLTSAEQSVKASQFVVQSAQATVKEAEQNLKFTIIRAPMSGTVSKLVVEKGERVVGTSQMAGTEMLRIADLNKMEVRVDVNENDIVRVSLGDTVVIDVDAYSYLDKTFKGKVTAIANTANNKVSSDAVTEFEVKIRILNDSFKDLMEEKGGTSPFRPGMTASVDIITNKKFDILAVPLGAVTTRAKSDSLSEKKSKNDELREIVFVNEDGIAKIKDVETGISNFEFIEILDGLTLDEEVVTGPFLQVSKKLEDGDDIKKMEKKEGRKGKGRSED
jgi:HlyD family secretion protein